MFKLIRKVKEPFGNAGGAIARETALFMGADQATAKKVEKLGSCAGRIGAGALLPSVLDPLGAIEEVVDGVETLLDM